jgi:hypothetical protein
LLPGRKFDEIIEKIGYEWKDETVKYGNLAKNIDKNY